MSKGRRSIPLPRGTATGYAGASMYTPTHKTSELVDKKRSIALEVLAKHANDVDQKARFPQESLDAMKAAKLLSAAIPKKLRRRWRLEHAGADRDVLRPSRRAAASSAMVLRDAPSSRSLASSRHGARATRIFEALHARKSSRSNSSSDPITSEVGVWGDTRKLDLRASREKDGKYFLDKDASTASYADPGRRPPRHLPPQRRRRQPSDQVLVLVRQGRTAPSTQIDDLGHDGHARHVQPGLQARVVGSPSSRSSPARSPTPPPRRWSRTRTSSGPRSVARHRDRRVLARGLRSCAPRRARRPGRCP